MTTLQQAHSRLQQLEQATDPAGYTLADWLASDDQRLTEAQRQRRAKVRAEVAATIADFEAEE